MTDGGAGASRGSGESGGATAVNPASKQSQSSLVSPVRRLAGKLGRFVGIVAEGGSRSAEPGLASAPKPSARAVERPPGSHLSPRPPSTQGSSRLKAQPPGAHVPPVQPLPLSGADHRPQQFPPISVAKGPSQPALSDSAADTELPQQTGGRRGVDYEVVSTRRGPGTFGAVLFLVLLAVLVWVAVSRAYRWVSEQLDPPGEPTGEVVLTLPLGSSTASISDLLAESGVVPSSRAYEWYVRFKGGPAFQAGEYTFQSNSSVWETMAVLEAGPSRVAQAAQQSLTIPEGLTVAQMAELLDETEGLSFSGADFIRAVQERRVLSIVAPTPRELPDGVIDPTEGQLFADTYFVDSQTSAEQLVALMVDRLDSVLTELGYVDSFRRVGLTSYEALIVASLIEREAQRPEDRAKVARVIYNRLAQGWSLGLDATVVYAVGTSELTAELLAVDSPYNTRVLVGLPPTPIAAPGRASLEAALNPEDGPWMYFVLTSADGTLSFSETDEEFQRDKAICQELGLCG